MPGDNAVYRIDADGVAREIFRARALIYALCWSDERLLLGTGPDGQLYEIREQGAENASLAKLENGQILSLLADPGGGVRVGTGDPGSVLRLSSGYVSEGISKFVLRSVVPVADWPAEVAWLRDSVLTLQT